MENDLVLELPTDIRSIEHAVEYVVRRCQACEYHAHRLRLNFRVGLTEALSNAMLYGNGHDPSKRVRVEVTVAQGEIKARITDQGAGFDPRGRARPDDPREPAQGGRTGALPDAPAPGRGVVQRPGNEVTLVLRLESGPPALEGGAQA